MSRSRQRQIRVVVIDDDPDMLFFAKTFLTMNTPKIVRVHTSSHINWRLSVPSWDEVAVAIVDLLMPISGIEVLREIQESYPHVDRIAWTAAKETVGIQVEKEGLAVVITKPDHNELRSQVLKLVGE